LGQVFTQTLVRNIQIPYGIIFFAKKIPYECQLIQNPGCCAFAAIFAIVLLLLYGTASFLCDPCAGGGRSAVEQRTPLLSSKEDDRGILGSSYDSVSDDGEGASAGCVVCCDARKDCFFLPCGHSATCYSCGARYVRVRCLNHAWDRSICI
jgi:hypothetical protein